MKLWNWLAMTVMMAGCVESFDLPVHNGDVNFLVIDGFLNTANGEVNVSLLRATKLTEPTSPPEEHATVTLEDSDGNSYPLAGLGSGNYKRTETSLDLEKQYRIYVKTSDGNEYRSLFSTPRRTPEITEVGWHEESNGLQITVDTEDATGNTRYYRWTFEETWEYRSVYTSNWILVEGEPEYRRPDEQVNICYQTLPSDQIFTTSTTGFTTDRVDNFELVFLPKGTEKLWHTYSILVKQYAISREAYEYFEKLKKTSQDLGGLFDPQPSKVTGNISNIADPSEVVLGYFDAGEANEKRLFVNFRDLPDNLREANQTRSCYADTVDLENLPQFASTSSNLLLDQITEGLMVVGYSFTTKGCADCRTRGGVTSKPTFWP